MVVLADRPDEISDRVGVGVAVGRVCHAAFPEGVVEGDHTARAEETEGLMQIRRVLALVGVSEDQVVVAIGQSRDHVQG